LSWATLLYVLFVPAILPSPDNHGDGGKQWGPRFLLIVLPLLCTIAALLMKRRAPSGSATLRGQATAAQTSGLPQERGARETHGPSTLGTAPRRAGAVLFAAAFVLGCYENTWRGPHVLAQDYATRILPVLRYVRADSARVVAAADRFIPHEMAATMDEKDYFLTKDARALVRLGLAAHTNGQPRFLYLSNDVEDSPQPFRQDATEYSLRVAPVFRFGECHIVHEVTVSAHPQRATRGPQ
jgi:hypothetical protein